MNAFEIIGGKGIGGPRPVFAVFGDDAYLRREAIGAILDAALEGGDREFGQTRFQGPQAELASVLDEVRTLPFIGPRRVVIVEDADPFVTANRKELEGFVERSSAGGVLVLSVKSWPSNTKLAKLVETKGLAIECRAPAEGELAAWVRRLAKQRSGIAIDREAAALLVELVGPEPGLLAVEVEKLAAYAGESRAASRDDVARVVGSGRMLDVWSMIDRASPGDASGALAILDRLLISGEAPQRLLAAMSSALWKLHHAGRLRIGRRPLADACRIAGLSRGAVEKVGRQHAHLGPTRVDRLPATLLRADLDLKGSSQLDVRTVIERLIVELAKPRAD